MGTRKLSARAVNRSLMPKGVEHGEKTVTLRSIEGCESFVDAERR